MKITFINNTKDFKFSKSNQLKKWINLLVRKYTYSIDLLNIIIVEKEEIKKINIDFLNHNYYTDIVTFYYGKEYDEADIVICPFVLLENSKTFNISYENEFIRVLAHGILHLIGYDDSNDKEIKEMRENEEKCIDLYYSILNEK